MELNVGARGALARKIADDTGVCPECGAAAERVPNGGGDVLLFFPHQPGCAAIAGMNEDDLLLTEIKSEKDALPWERAIVDG